MDDIQKLTLYLPQLLIYLVPGFIGIYLFRFFRGSSKKKDEKVNIFYSIILSYITIAVYSRIINIGMDTILLNDTSQHIISLTILMIIASYLAYIVLSIPIVSNILHKLGIKSGIHSDILDEFFNDKEGLWVYLYLSNVTYLGKLIKYENINENNRDTYVVLKNYTIYDVSDNSVLKDCLDVNDDLAMINLKNVSRIEMVYSHNSSVLKKILK